MVLQITSGTVAEYPWIEVLEGDDGPPCLLRSVRRPTHPHPPSTPSGTAYGVVLELERPVSAPGTAALEWVTDYPYDEAPVPDARVHARPVPPRRRAAVVGAVPPGSPAGVVGGVHR